MHGAITARSISNITGLQMSTTLYTLRRLQTDGFVIEGQRGRSSSRGGKPPRLWQINGDYGIVLGAELLSKEMRTVILDFSTRQLHREKRPLPPRPSPEKLLDFIKQQFRRTLTVRELKWKDLLGVGLAIPGLVDGPGGLIRYAHAFGFRDFALSAALAEKLRVAVRIDNDANAGALGMKWLDANFHNLPNFLFISIQQDFSGMGVGLMIEHRLYRGAHGFAGETEDILPRSAWKRLFAKAVEQYGNRCRLCQYLEKHPRKTITVKLATSLAEKGDAGARFLLSEISKRIARRLRKLVYLFDPMAVVIGGDIIEARSFITDVIESEFVGLETAKPTLYYSAFGAYTGAMGAAGLVLSEIYT